MLPFCGYNMGDYFQHWLDTGAALAPEARPRLYSVNWFRQDEEGRFLWPGFGDNSRVLKWVFERLEGTAGGRETPIGVIPRPDDLDTTGLDLDPADLDMLLAFEQEAWRAEVALIEAHYERFGTHLPEVLREHLTELGKRSAG
jgi:phosphoenolpyruvate carboxykinase (GTP)